MYGLGLALARALIELTEGTLWVEDLPAGGCAFVFELGWKRTGARAVRSPGGRPPGRQGGQGGQSGQGQMEPPEQT